MFSVSLISISKDSFYFRNVFIQPFLHPADSEAHWSLFSVFLFWALLCHGATTSHPEVLELTELLNKQIITQHGHAIV